MAKTILITGATGQQGGAVVKYLSQAGEVNILAIARDPSKATSLTALPNVTVVKGDFKDPESLFSGRTIDSLFLMVPGMEDELAITKAFLDAAKRAGVTYVVNSGVDLSGVDSTGIHTFDVKRDAWAYLQTLGIKSTYIGPAGFLETFFWPTFPEMTQAWPESYKHKYVCTDDIGHVAALALLNPDKYAGRRIMLAGDEVDKNDVKTAWKEIVGADLGVVHATEPYVVNLWQQLYKHPFEADVAACRAEFPFLYDLRRWLKEVYVPATKK